MGLMKQRLPLHASDGLPCKLATRRLLVNAPHVRRNIIAETFWRGYLNEV